MKRYSLIIIKNNKKIVLEGNDNIIWYINQKIKNYNLENILNLLKDYKKLAKINRKINIKIIGLKNINKILEKYKNDFNIDFEKSYQEKITKFF